jgi:hypothetical protein
MKKNELPISKMTDKEKADCLCQLHRDQLDRFKHTINMGFKINLTLWTFIVVAGYSIRKEIDLDSFTDYYLFILLYFAIGFLLGFLYYLGWWKFNYNSQIIDKAIGIQYRNEINKLTGIILKDEKGNDKEINNPFINLPIDNPFHDGKKNTWIKSEAGITFFLYVCVFIYLLL